MSTLMTNIQSVWTMLFTDSGIFTKVIDIALSNEFVAIGLSLTIAIFAIGVLKKIVSAFR